MKKLTALVLCVLLAVSLLTGCFGGTKEYTCQELTMSVPSTMKDVSSQSDFSDFTFALDSSKIAIFGLKEKFSDFDGQEMTLDDYADAVMAANGTQGLAITRSTADYIYFTYESDTSEGTYKYVAGCFKGSDAFWLVQVAALQTDFELETFLGYLDTVKLG